MIEDKVLFRNWRKRMGLTQVEASRKLGICLTGVRDCEQGLKKIRRPYRYAMAAIEHGLTEHEIEKCDQENG